MNSERVGRFIAEQRKLCGLTQNQLAERLHVTDKAISRWETGKGYPDVQTLTALCEALGISLNELLRGEKIPPEQAAAAAEENVADAYSSVRRTKKNSRLIIAAVCILAVTACLLLSAIFRNNNIDHYQMALYSREKASVMEELRGAALKNFAVSRETVCTNFDIRFNPNGEITYVDIQLNDPLFHQTIQLKVFTADNQLTCDVIRAQEVISEEDGMLFDDVIELTKQTDFFALENKNSDIRDFTALSVGGESTIFQTFPDDRVVQFGTHQHLFKDGEVKQVFSSEGMTGKYYEVMITPETGINGSNSCCSIYVKR